MESVLSGEKLVSQPQMQALLQDIERREGLPAALERLFSWCLGVGYFPEGIFESNLVLEFPDKQSPITYRTQINYSRLTYRAPQGARPTGCPICFDQVGSPQKPLLRVYEFQLGKAATPYFIQLTPFPLRRYHYILIQREHSPMRVDSKSVDELLDLVDRVPEFTACSNSDVRNAGVSILDHHHYQVFKQFQLPVMSAQAHEGLTLDAPQVKLELLDYPLATLRLRGAREAVWQKASAVIAGWKGLLPGENTCNLMACRKGEEFEFYLFFRNPAYLTPPDLLRIKSEGVGIVEACGEGIYPPPTGEHAEQRLAEIKSEGLTIIKRILGGLNPVPEPEREELFDLIRSWV